jgi:tetratricopeptide (TPR) repeat protein
MSASATAIPQKPASPWIYRPWLDLLVGCGGWSAPLLLLAWLGTSPGGSTGGSYDRGWTLAFYGLALIFNYPHFMATVYRAYHTREEFTRYRIYTVHLTALLALTAVLTHADYRLLPWVFTLYIDWSPWHYTGQNFGLLMMFARRNGTEVKPAERRLLHLAFIASYVMLLVSFHTGASNDPLILSLGFGPKVSAAARMVAGGAFALLAGWVMVRWTRRSGLGAMTAPLTLLASQFLWFVLPSALELGYGLAVPQTRYSSGVLAVLHSAQYLWITSYYARREARAAGEASWSMTAYFATLLAGGIALFIPGPWLVSYAFHYDFASSFLIFTALVNIHHFILDGAVWKLRDTGVAALLVERGKTESGPPRDLKAEQQRREPAAAGRWLGGRTAGAHALRVGVAVLLFLWGGLDQVRFFFTSDPSNLPHLMDAASLIPYDSSLQMLIARAESQAGHTDEALEALGRAVAANPADRRPQQARARALIQAQRFDEAYELYRRMLVRYPRDVDALVNFGLLAIRLGRPGEAIESWEKALDVDAGQMNAQLYLAEALDRQGQPAAAARHYEAYLKLAASATEGQAGATNVPAGAPSRVTPSQRAAVMVELGEAYERTRQAAQALGVYRSAVALAVAAGDAKQEGIAQAHLAEALDRAGQPAAAARAYQRALELDERTGDAQGEGIDWFNYGQFLRRRGLPEKLAYACFLRAEALLGPVAGADLETARLMRREMESRLGGEAAAVRNNLAAELAVAISQGDSAFAAAHH